MSNTEETLKQVCKDLKIEFDKDDMQDWGIVNSDPKRVAEFINYYKNNELEDGAKFHVFELIVASYNDAVLARLVKGELKEDFLEVVSNSHNTPGLKIVRDYWKEIYDRKTFPVGRLL
ncbi:hypothetical protein [Mucilaginibacter segetis]|uniref:Uncharacterized protein n=1 Tax=Mucilaginibacter segetis TaxID=2793071 RepID=A0A934PSF3_9SPHI|nr:hypothetical protein [Mucilaginibacter segetis]MBK0378356.1 hypothetical protein [Mucilaginibacter segetis]